MLQETAHNLLMPFVPCLEVPATSNSFLPASPRQLLRQGHFIKVPTIIAVSYTHLDVYKRQGYISNRITTVFLNSLLN